MVGVNAAIGKRAVGLQLKGLRHTSSCMTTLTIPYPPDTLRPTILYPPDTLPHLAVPPIQKGHETSGLEGTWDQTYPNPPPPWTDRHLWKHNLPLRSVMMLQWLLQTLGCKWNLLMKLSGINIQGRCHLKCKTGEWVILEKKLQVLVPNGKLGQN